MPEYYRTITISLESRKHQSLKNKTPSEIAEIDVDIGKKQVGRVNKEVN